MAEVRREGDLIGRTAGGNVRKKILHGVCEGDLMEDPENRFRDTDRRMRPVDPSWIMPSGYSGLRVMQFTITVIRTLKTDLETGS